MLKNYFKIAIRNLQRNKVYALINVMGLALSMSCGILIFALVKHHLSFDNFHANSDRIYRIVTEQHRDNISYTNSVPNPLGKAFRNDYTFGEKVARICTFDDQLITVKQGNEIKKFKDDEGIAFTETEFFDIFNYPLLIGDKKTVLSEPNTAIMTERAAKKYFGNENPINKTFKLDNRIEFKVTGILKDLPANSDRQTDIYASYLTLKSYNEWAASDDSWGGISSSMQCFVLLRPGISPAQVEKVMPAYVKKYRPTSKNVHHYKFQPLAEMHFDARYNGPMDKKNLWVLSFIGLFLIITACVNFINLATAQALKRSKEVGVRKVLGSVRMQLFWQFISETSLISILGAVVAIVLAFAALPYVNTWFSSQISINLVNDWQLMLFIVSLIVVVTLFSGSYPGLILAGFQPVLALKGKLSQQNIGGFNTRRTLIITQFAISQVLIIGMVIIANQMKYAQQSDLGFQKEAIVTIPIASGTDFNKQKTIKNQFSALSGVEKVSLFFRPPASGSNWSTSVKFDNRTEDEVFRVNVKSGDDEYLSTFDLELVTGRNIFPADSMRECLVNETFVRKLNLASPQEVIGKTISMNGGHSTGPIVGVVKDFHDRSFHEEINPVLITTLADNYDSYGVKLNMANAQTTLASVEKIWTQAHPDQIYEYQFLDESIAEFYETESIMLKMIQAFSGIAIFIGCLGLYGLVSFMVTQKTKEIGIRKVLGSSIGSIIWIFGKEFSRLIIIAFLVAAPLAWWLMSNWLQDFKFRIDIKIDVFILAITSTFVVAALTVGYQVIKAALMNPMKSLRSE
ncbi:ABC transporter permease [Emticicia sp. BO119]|uniref:ABC transporter permease n=1 Tax=Emticicia sp. BO119 TaxID=2757768 RepID=UPI0015EFF1AD|nr:ABC transporter permease [Emticicia sp. BO119]MBA4850872.1 ABC transporter permease [Emticicia sp. BO119]